MILSVRSSFLGLWADGPTSAWNGDYHLNINLQMAYWAAGAIGDHDTYADNCVDVFIMLITFTIILAKIIFKLCNKNHIWIITD